MVRCLAHHSDSVDKHTLDLFDTRDMAQQASLMKAIDTINGKMGRRTIFLAATGAKQEWVGASSLRSRPYTTDWNSLMQVRADF